MGRGRLSTVRMPSLPRTLSRDRQDGRPGRWPRCARLGQGQASYGPAFCNSFYWNTAHGFTHCLPRRRHRTARQSLNRSLPGPRQKTCAAPWSRSSAAPTSLGRALASAHDVNFCTDMKQCTMGGTRRGKDAAAGRAAESTCAQHTVLPSPRTRTPAQRPFLFAARSPSLKPFPWKPRVQLSSSQRLHRNSRTGQTLQKCCRQTRVTCHTVIVALQFESPHSAATAYEAGLGSQHRVNIMEPYSSIFIRLLSKLD